MKSFYIVPLLLCASASVAGADEKKDCEKAKAKYADYQEACKNLEPLRLDCTEEMLMARTAMKRKLKEANADLDKCKGTAGPDWWKKCEVERSKASKMAIEIDTNPSAFYSGEKCSSYKALQEDGFGKSKTKCEPAVGNYLNFAKANCGF